MLLGREKTPVTEAVERLAGMQAQEPRPPFVGLWTRVEGFERDDLHAALRERELVRAMLMRATLHLVSARDSPAFRPAVTPALAGALRALGARAKGLELDRVLPAARALLCNPARRFQALRG